MALGPLQRKSQDSQSYKPNQNKPDTIMSETAAGMMATNEHFSSFQLHLKSVILFQDTVPPSKTEALESLCFIVVAL